MLANRSIVWSFNPPHAEWTTRLGPYNRFLNASGADGIPGALRLVHSIATASACSGGSAAYVLAIPVSQLVWQVSFCEYMRNVVGLPCKVLPTATISGASCSHDISASGAPSAGIGVDCSANAPALKTGTLYVLPVQLGQCAREQVSAIHAATYAVAFSHLRNASRHVTVQSARRSGQQSFVGARTDLSVGAGIDSNWLRYLLNQPLLDLGVQQACCPAPNRSVLPPPYLNEPPGPPGAASRL